MYGSVNIGEEQRRIDAKILSATAKHMSDAKWRALFVVLRDAGAGPVRWKFVRDDRVFLQPIPNERGLLADRLGDVMPSPYSPFREIEWLEVPMEQSNLFSRLRSTEKEFPWCGSAQGLRVVAYEW